jgi:hypothetical protein
MNYNIPEEMFQKMGLTTGSMEIFNNVAVVRQKALAFPDSCYDIWFFYEVLRDSVLVLNYKIPPKDC